MRQKNVNEEDHKEEGNGEEEESILSRLAGFVTKLLSENRPKERLNQEEALKALNEMGFEDNALNRDILEESRTLQEAVCKLLEK